MKGLFKTNFQGRNAFIPNDYYLRAYRRLNVGRRSRTFAAWREALALSLLFDRCVFSLPRTLCFMVEWGVVGPLQGESCPFRCRRTIPQLQTRSRLCSFSAWHWGVTWWTLRSIPTDSILWWGDRVNRPSSQEDCDDCPAEQVSVRETDRNPFVLEGVRKMFLRKRQTEDKVINST